MARELMEEIGIEALNLVPFRLFLRPGARSLQLSQRP